MDALQEKLHRAMLRPDFYPGGVGPVEHIETHVSRLYLVGTQVYKVKKPVDLGFLDFTTLERRRFFCQEEIRLNRRLCPDIYEEVVPLRRRSGGFTLEGPGETVEVALRMKRLPADRMLDRLLQKQGENLESWMPRLARRLTSFHREAGIRPSSEGPAQSRIVAQNWEENFLQTDAFGEDLLSPRARALFKRRVTSYLGNHHRLFDERHAEGWVRDGHGDLHAEHVCLVDPICIYDCIEFNRRFRVGDVLEDLAFLLMDLEYHRRRDLAAALEKAYLESWDALRGEDELLNFFRLYRAYVRGKVEGFLARDPEALPESRKAAASRAIGHFNLGLGYLCPPQVVVLSGLMGVGKSTLAEGLGGCTGAEVLRSDVIRKELAGIHPDRAVPLPYGEALYSSAMTEQTYAELLKRADRGLASGRTVILDASFSRIRDRERVRRLAKRRRLPMLLILAECDEETARFRLEHRRRQGGDPSDGRPELFAQQQAAFDFPTENEPHLPVDTRRELDYNVHSILCRMANIRETSR